MERTCVRACVHTCARVLMIIKSLATDLVVQHANITQLIVRKERGEINQESRREPDVYETRDSQGLFCTAWNASLNKQR